MHKHKIAIMGDRDSIVGFTPLGLDAFAEDSMEEPAKVLRNLIENNYAVIYITESLAERLSDEISKVSELPTPVIVPIPGITGNKGMGMKAIGEAVEKAVGSDILADT